MSGESLQDLIDEAQSKFVAQRQARHEMGAQKYGPVQFLEPDNDLFRMLQEELVDAANYAEYLFIRLEIIHNATDGRPMQLKDTPLGPTGVVNPYSKG